MRHHTTCADSMLRTTSTSYRGRNTHHVCDPCLTPPLCVCVCVCAELLLRIYLDSQTVSVGSTWEMIGEREGGRRLSEGRGRVKRRREKGGREGGREYRVKGERE